MSKFTVRYVATRDDHVAKLQLYAGRTSAARWFPPATYAAIVGMSWLSAWLFYVRQGDKNYFYLASALLALFLTVSLPWLYRRYQDSFLSSLLTEDNLRGLVGPTELTVDDGWIEERRGYATLRAPLADVDGIEDGVDHVVVQIAPLIAILVPHRAFEFDEARQEFVTFIRSIRASRPT